MLCYVNSVVRLLLDLHLILFCFVLSTRDMHGRVYFCFECDVNLFSLLTCPLLVYVSRYRKTHRAPVGAYLCAALYSVPLPFLVTHIQISLYFYKKHVAFCFTFRMYLIQVAINNSLTAEENKKILIGVLFLWFLSNLFFFFFLCLEK